jgi:methylenetetrahydrofolate dehydrogenase (NADP+) / methenyltetrahydrofolate cyclohydrolase
MSGRFAAGAGAGSASSAAATRVAIAIPTLRDPMAHIIDGKAIAGAVRAQVRDDVARFHDETGRRPGLATVLVGDDPASGIYVGGKQKASKEAGIEGFDHRLGTGTTRDELVEVITALNADERVSGIIVQLPLPGHLDGTEMTGLVRADKDVDGLTPMSAGLLALGRPGLRPCTPAGVMRLLAEAGAELQGAEAVVIGRSNLFGKPMAQLLLQANATVTVCHSRTKDLPAVTRRADVLIAAVGRDRMVKADWVKPGATVIDVGMNRSDDGLNGDVDFDQVEPVAGAITPVPGGVGPMTIAMLLANTVEAARMQSSGA